MYLLVSYNSFFTSQIECDVSNKRRENINMNHFHLALTGGCGTHYGGEFGFSLETAFYNNNSHHCSFLFGLGKNWEVLPTYSAGFRYGFGKEDRIFTDLLFGCTEVIQEREWVYDLDNDKYLYDKTTYTPCYDPVLMIGYQRVMNSGFTFSLSAGLYYDKTSNLFQLCNSKYIPFNITLSTGVGYYL